MNWYCSNTSDDDTDIDTDKWSEVKLLFLVYSNDFHLRTKFGKTQHLAGDTTILSLGNHEVTLVRLNYHLRKTKPELCYSILEIIALKFASLSKWKANRPISKS